MDWLKIIAIHHKLILFCVKIISFNHSVTTDLHLVNAKNEHLHPFNF
jgi:hypothetical protein